jgi:hypothetical protein
MLTPYLNFSLYGILMTATRGAMPKHTRLLFVLSFRSSSINTCNIGYLYLYIRNTIKTHTNYNKYAILTIVFDSKHNQIATVPQLAPS